jgi:hypothetical protein
MNRARVDTNTLRLANRYGISLKKDPCGINPDILFLFTLFHSGMKILERDFASASANPTIKKWRVKMAGIPKMSPCGRRSSRGNHKQLMLLTLFQ